MAYPCPLPAAPITAAAAAPLRRSQQPNFGHLLSTATSLTHLKQIHANLIKSPNYHLHYFNLILSSLSFPSYALCLLSAFPAAVPPPPPKVSNNLLKRLSRSSNPKNAILFHHGMQSKGFVTDRFTFPPLLKAASKTLALSEGKMIHALAAKLGYAVDPFVETALMGMYAACGLISDARLVFDKMSHRDVVTWHIMIDGYCQNRLFDDVVALIKEMKTSDTEPDEKIYTTILSACSRAGNLELGKLIHSFISENNSNVVFDSHLQTALLNMYITSGAMDMAQSLYDRMLPKNVVTSTAMISGYSKTGNIDMARVIFDRTVDKDLVCWSAMISCYADSDKPQEALKIFDNMLQCGLKPDQVAMLSVISACAHLGALGRAKEIHLFVDGQVYGEALPIRNSLIDMYAKCGSLTDAKIVFSRMRTKNVITWTTMISAFAVHGDVDNALKHFHLMKSENVEPNWVTFVGVLYACSHGGLVKEGQQAFDTMVNEYGITPKLEHYGCMVDLYGRAKRISEALEIVETMPMPPNVIIWGSLMAACRNVGEFELGEFAAKRLLELNPDHDGAHVFLSNVYAKEGKWEGVGGVRNHMKQRGIAKERGQSMIEMGNEMHKFLTGDRSHKLTDEIYAKLDEVVDDVKQAGYVPDTSCVLVDIEEVEKEEVVVWHSEKLALCYGLISHEKGSCIRIIKNIRICEDCHRFMKIASEVLDREIVIRDRTRFHHFSEGLCSCKDYW